ncbi:Ig-like domain-containing protein [Pseudomonas uvaldensis]|uniref:Ig-like domain-containing protein n=1 Tax=Pseudomonas uvaldensis TaxID=2878385 RepID=UPI0038CD6672|nr:Ig-like domain-containing protein [Pseudomonas uvaldensis]
MTLQAPVFTSPAPNSTGNNPPYVTGRGHPNSAVTIWETNNKTAILGTAICDSDGNFATTLNLNQASHQNSGAVLIIGGICSNPTDSSGYGQDLLFYI